MTEAYDDALRRGGLELPPVLTRIVGGLSSCEALSLATQWVHNITLVGGRMAALGETVQAPFYTTIALKTAWREMGISILFLNFPQRMAIQAVCVSVVNLCDIFHRPDLSGW